MIQINEQKQPPLKEKKPVEKTMTLRFGQSLVLLCPDVDVDNLLAPVAWVNGTQLLSEEHIATQTKQRVSLNGSHVLRFKHVTLDDDNTTLVCWVEQTLKGIYHLRIDRTTVTEYLTPYYKVLFISYGVNLAIVVGGILVQHQKKVKQVKRKRARHRHRYR